MRLVYMHIPKTGGRTLRTLLEYFYTHEEVHIVDDLHKPDIPASACLIMAHLPYGLVPVNGHTLHLTILRHPARRIASYYQMCKRNRPGWALYERFWNGGEAIPMVAFARGDLGLRDQIDNAMVRQLAGWDVLIANRPVHEGDYLRAQANLDTCLFGLTERYDEFVMQLGERMGWSIPDYPRQNVAIPYTISVAELAELNAINDWDLRLYDWAAAEFERRSDAR